MKDEKYVSYRRIRRHDLIRDISLTLRFQCFVINGNRIRFIFSMTYPLSTAKYGRNAIMKVFKPGKMLVSMNFFPSSVIALLGLKPCPVAI